MMSKMDYVALDNLPDTANDVLNILWDKNRKMTLDELTVSVNEEFSQNWSKREIRQFIQVLIHEEYIEKTRHNLTVYYAALSCE